MYYSLEGISPQLNNYAQQHLKCRWSFANWNFVGSYERSSGRCMEICPLISQLQAPKCKIVTYNNGDGLGEIPIINRGAGKWAMMISGGKTIWIHLRTENIYFWTGRHSGKNAHSYLVNFFFDVGGLRLHCSPWLKLEVAHVERAVVLFVPIPCV